MSFDAPACRLGQPSLFGTLSDGAKSGNGQRSITADTALRLGLFFSMEPRFRLHLQAEYDMRIAERNLRAKVVPRIRVFQPSTG